jgi:hypothetical protein
VLDEVREIRCASSSKKIDGGPTRTPSGFPSTRALSVSYLAELMKTMTEEPTFLSVVFSEDSADADELVLFEVWNGTLEEWFS